MFSQKDLAKKCRFLNQATTRFCKNFIITLVFEKNANLFSPKIDKIVENSDRNIDPGF
jgi:hypothetical protein